MSAPQTQSQTGQVITFYSYKGGVGRSMALANVACLLAQTNPSGRGVLLVDWDLEAPGLHHFFRQRFTRHFQTAAVSDEMLDQQAGLLDLCCDLNDAAEHLDYPRTDLEEDAERLVNDLELARYTIATDIPGLSLMKAGRRDDGYAERVNTFPWEGLYKRQPHLYRALAERLSEQYQYVLIDSRTGETDTSGVCTMIMPEKLIVVFTPSQQSLTGVRRLAERAVQYRKRSDDLRPLTVFPLPSRIETSEDKLRKEWRNNAEFGYQPLFEELFRQAFNLPRCDMNDYFDEVQIQHFPRYSYGEQIAALIETGGDRLSLTHSFQRFANAMVNSRVPWKQEEAKATPSAALNPKAAQAEAALAQLEPDEQEHLLRALTRLVRVAGPSETSGDTGQQIAASEFSAPELAVLRRFAETRLLTLERDTVSGQESVRVADEELIRNWRSLQTELDRDREFFRWRQQLQLSLAQWEASGRDHTALLSGRALEVTQNYQTARPAYLNQAETAFVTASSQHIIATATQTRRKRSYALAAAAVIMLLLVAGGLFAYLKSRRAQTSQQAAIALTAAGIEAADKGNYDVALNKYDQSLQIAALPETYLSRAEAQRALGQNQQAVADYNSALASNDKSLSAYLGRGQSHLRLGDYELAVKDFDKVIYDSASDNKAKSAALQGKGEAYLRKEDADAAIALQTQAIQLDPDNDALYLARATAYQRKGDKQLAVDDYKQTLNLTRDDQLKDRATQGLILLGTLPRPTPTAAASPLLLPTRAATPTVAASPAAPVVTRIYLQYLDRQDLPMVTQIGKALGALGKVQKPELVTQPTTGDVRYFYLEDADQANRIRAAAQAVLSKQNIGLKLAVKYTRGFSNKVPRGWIEVWLPSLAEVNAPPAEYKSNQAAQTAKPVPRAPAARPTPTKRARVIY